MDYGDFSMTGKLVNLKLFDVKPRPATSKAAGGRGAGLDLHRYIRAAKAEQATAAGNDGFQPACSC